MSFFNKMVEALGLVDTIEDDDDYMDDYNEQSSGFGDSSYSAQTSFGSSFASELPKPQMMMDRGADKSFDINMKNNYKGSTKVATYNTSDQIKMIVINPDSYDEAREICDYIRSGKPVVVNLEGMEFEVSQRVMDFLSGSCYSLNGNIQRVAKNIFIVAPNNIDVTADFKSDFNKQKTSTLPWMSSAMNGKTGMEMRG